MGNSYPVAGKQDLRLITIETGDLRERLNKIYRAMRRRAQNLSSSGLFEYLWEMKELALLERRNSVQVPTTWLEELEDDFFELSAERSYSH